MLKIKKGDKSPINGVLLTQEEYQKTIKETEILNKIEGSLSQNFMKN